MFSFFQHVPKQCQLQYQTTHLKCHCHHLLPPPQSLPLHILVLMQELHFMMWKRLIPPLLVYPNLSLLPCLLPLTTTPLLQLKLSPSLQTTIRQKGLVSRAAEHCLNGAATQDRIYLLCTDKSSKPVQSRSSKILIDRCCGCCFGGVSHSGGRICSSSILLTIY